jgi:hypothetical protein
MGSARVVLVAKRGVLAERAPRRRVARAPQPAFEAAG